MNTNKKITQIMDFDEAKKSTLNKTDKYVEQSVRLKNAHVRVADSDDITIPSLTLTIRGEPGAPAAYLVDEKKVEIFYTYWFRVDSENNWKSKYSPIIDATHEVNEAKQKMYFNAHPTETWSTYSRFFDTIKNG